MKIGYFGSTCRHASYAKFFLTTDSWKWGVSTCIGFSPKTSKASYKQLLQKVEIPKTSRFFWVNHNKIVIFYPSCRWFKCSIFRGTVADSNVFIWKNYLIYTVSLNQLPPKYISEFVRVCAKSVLRLPASLVLHVHRIKHSIKLIQQSSSTYILEATLPPPPSYTHSIQFTISTLLVVYVGKRVSGGGLMGKSNGIPLKWASGRHLVWGGGGACTIPRMKFLVSFPPSYSIYNRKCIKLYACPALLLNSW